MALNQKVTMEVERLLNIASGFGWEKTKEEIYGKQLLVTLSKEIITKDEMESGGGAE